MRQLVVIGISLGVLVLSLRLAAEPVATSAWPNLILRVAEVLTR